MEYGAEPLEIETVQGNSMCITEAIQNAQHSKPTIKQEHIKTTKNQNDKSNTTQIET